MSRHPVLPLPFHLFSSPSPTRFPKPRPHPCPATIWQFQAAGARVRRARGRPLVLSPLRPSPGPGTGRLSATRLGARGPPWPERRGGRAGRAAPETAGLPGGSLTLKVTGRGETTGPRRSRGHRSRLNSPGGCPAPRGSPGDTIEDVAQRSPRVPTLPSIKGVPFHSAWAPTLRALGSGLLESPAHVCVCVAGVRGWAHGDCKRSGVTLAAATFVSAETWEAAEERRPAEWARAWLGSGEGASSLREAACRAPPASPPLPSPRRAAPQRPRLAPMPRVCLTPAPGGWAGGGIPGGANPGAGPQPRRRERPSPSGTSRPKVPVGWRLRHLNGPGDRQGSTEGDPWQGPHCSPGAGKLTHSLSTERCRVFSRQPLPSALFSQALFTVHMFSARYSGGGNGNWAEQEFSP